MSESVEKPDTNEKPKTPDYAKVVIVPVANPATASGLIKLATALAHPEHGRILALIVSLGDAEKEAKAIADIEPKVKPFQEAAEKQTVELMTRSATSVARGILDVVREEQGDLVILGLAEPHQGHATVGTISESVAATAPCDVLMYRQGASPAFDRIVVPVNGSDHARIACRVSLMLSNTYHKPVEAMYVEGNESAFWQARARIEASLDGLPGQNKVKRTVVTHQNVVPGLLSRVSEDDLIVVGFTRLSGLERWLYDDLSRGLLDKAPGPVILTSRSNETPDDLNRFQRFLLWTRPTLTAVEQDDLVRHAQDTARVSLDFMVLMLVASVLATLGLVTNSGAVIIGAMLVAPLMSPLIAFSTGMTTGRGSILRQSTSTIVQAVGLALVVSFVIGFLSPLPIITPEMAARGNPRLPDMGIALASGLIGAYATARRGIPAALAGVAIAAALVPPICTAGLALAFENMALWRGASLLFLTNILSIVLAAWGVFFWMGMRPRRVEESRTRQYTSLVLVVVLIAVSLLLLQNVDPRTYELGINDVLDAAFEEGEVISFDIRRDDPLLVIATVRASPELLASGRFEGQVEAARESLAAHLEDESVDLRVVVQPEVRLPSPAEQEIEAILNDGFSGDITNILIIDGADGPITTLPLTDTGVERVTIQLTIRTSNPASITAEAGAVRQALADRMGVPVALDIDLDTGLIVGD